MFTKFHHIWTNPSRGFRCRTLNFGVFSYASATQNRGSQGLYDKTVSRIKLKPFPVDRTYKILLLYMFSGHLVHFLIVNYSVHFGDFYDSGLFLQSFQIPPEDATLQRATRNTIRLLDLVSESDRGNSNLILRLYDK